MTDLPSPGVNPRDPLAGAGPVTSGRFRVDLRPARWWWSSGMWTLHGYPVDPAVRPSLDSCLLCRHVRSDDFRALDAGWRRLTHVAGAVAVDYHLVGADGVVRLVRIVAAWLIRDGAPAIGGTLALVEPARPPAVPAVTDVDDGGPLMW